MPLSDAEKKALRKALSLTESGGIYYEGARVTGGTANRWLLVGVGGMGTSTLIRVKHEIMNRMRLPDEGNRKKPPKNIAFLAIDTQEGSLERMSYSDTKFEADEIVYTGAQGSNWTAIVQNMQEDKRNDASGYASFLPDNLPPLPTDCAAGSMRLLGRVGLFNNQYKLISKINTAVGKISTERGDTQICLFAGVGGGTGSGSFIDLAFLLKNILGAGGANCPLSAYLYLPDIQSSAAAGNTERITNAVAALKELDQIIHLGSQNPSYNRPYVFGKGGPTITFTGNPFDYCYLINKTDVQDIVHDVGDVVGDVAETVFELVADQTAEAAGGGPNDSGQAEINANATAYFNGVDGRSQFPATYRYMSTCSNVRRIPFLEINTLVVSEMFEQLTNTVLRNPVTIESINRDLKLLGFSTNITGLDPKNIVNDESITNIESAMQTILGRQTAAGDDLFADTRLFKIGGVNGYTADDIWSFTDCFGGDGSPYHAAYQALAQYQIGLNANLGLQTGDGQYIGQLEMNLKKFILEKISNPLYGPVYLADIIGGLSTSLNLIALFSRVKTRCRGAAQTARNEADLATEDTEHKSGFKFVFDEVKRSHRRPRSGDVEDYLYYLGEWQTHSRTEQMYIYMEKFCDAIIKVYTKYYLNVLEPLKDAVLTVANIFAENKQAIIAKAGFYQKHPDEHLLIYPLDFVTQYQTIFDNCVNNTKAGFLDNIRSHLPEWIGITISAESNNSADHVFIADKTKTKIPESISAFVSRFLNGLYGAVNVETIYQQKFQGNFPQRMQDELIRIFDSAYPLFSKNTLPSQLTTQEYAILFVPNICTNIITAARNVKLDALNGRIQVKLCGDVSRLSIVKVGEGYPLVMNRYLNTWENIYETSKQGTTHLSVEWEKCFPSPNVETSWSLTGYNSRAIYDRNKKLREKIMFCYEHGLISIRSTNPLRAQMLLSVTERFGQKTEDYIRNAKLGGTTLEQKEASLNEFFEDIWQTGITEDLPGMGRYKRGNHETERELIENVTETTIMDSRLCGIIEREYVILCGYVALKESFKIPELYVKALACKLVKPVAKNFHVRLYTDGQLSQYEEIIKDDSAKLQMIDFDYLVYEKFKVLMDNQSKGTKTWSQQIIANWDSVIVSEDRSALSERMQKMIDRFGKSLKFYNDELSKTVDERTIDMCEKKIDFYEMCILYARKLSLGLTDVIDEDNDSGEGVELIDF